ncbi:hypothetical protein KWF73_00380 [Acinetobacter pittii]|jgi:hypothetical protein|uniref:DUF6932 family protein n=1 Tax=Acinetobacter TaxID=469 RepID=UPI000A34E5D9|nr:MULTISPECIES: hypothetical protein [Acinetobacter]MCG5266747.1 hypothetical protein [Acinetobacter pittii]MDS7958890.1 hypothetical protein [Acinetobacter sp. V104_13]MDS7983019.1 hypothetical protein [Acinetobacter sp. V104_3]OTS54401.1 hypothetical protein CAT00_07435 [Acinetobacter pittii]
MLGALLDMQNDRSVNGKIIYPSLLPAGVHKIKLHQFEETFLNHFDEKRTRAYLCNRFRELLDELRKFKINMIIWVDGSFCSLKPHPDDIDIVIFLDESEINGMQKAESDKLFVFLEKRDVIKARYRCDLFFEKLNDVKQYYYWKGLFSFNQLNEAKGFIQIKVEANEYPIS